MATVVSARDDLASAAAPTAALAATPTAALAATPLPLRRKLGWAVGDYGINLYWQALNILLLPFYTDVLGLDARLAGTTLLIVAFWDGAIDPVMGGIADRTRTRWGRYRPYLLFASPLLAVCFTLSFITPDASQAGLFAFAVISQLALRVAYTLVTIPYASLAARITSDPNERASMAGHRMQFAALGGASVAFLLPSFVAWIGRDAEHAYALAAAGVALLSLPVFWLCFALTREPPDGRRRDGEPRGFHVGSALEDIRSILHLARENGPLARIFGCIIVSSLAFTMTNKCLKYYTEHYLGRPDLDAYILPLSFFTMFAFCPLWAWLAQRTSKRHAWLIASVVSAVGYVAFLFDQTRDPWVSAALVSLTGFGNAAFQVLFWAMLPDTVEYNHWKLGARHEGKVFGCASFAKQLALGVNGFLLGWLLTAIGYEPNQTQAESTLIGLKMIMALVPLAGLGVAAWLMWGYPLDQKFHRHIVEATRTRA
jgi:GPH family glycoside/pentoside/hexuronide:cation symporter